jgi:hypothetical protein
MTSSGLKVAIVNRIGGFLQRHLPNRTKRLIFLASLSARLKNTQNFDNATLTKLNQVMVLSHTESAIKLPVQLSRAIWNGRSAGEIFNADLQKESLQKERLAELVANVINSMPAWLCYGEKETIEQDVSRLLNNRDAVLGV